MIYEFEANKNKLSLENRKLRIIGERKKEIEIADIESIKVKYETVNAFRELKRIPRAIFVFAITITAIKILSSFAGSLLASFNMDTYPTFHFDLYDTMITFISGLILGTLYAVLFDKKNKMKRISRFEINISLKNPSRKEIINCNEDKLEFGSERFDVIKRNAEMLVMFINKWLKDAEILSVRVPAFNLEREMQNPYFFNYLNLYSNSLDKDIIANAYQYVLKNHDLNPEAAEEIVNISPKTDMNNEAQYCRKCGVKIPNDGEYCHKCGTKIVFEED